MTNERFLSPPQIAKILGISPDKVLAFIHKGELKAVNTSLSDRSRWKVDPDDFKTFCDSRSNRASMTPARRKPKHLPRAKKEYV